MSMDRNPNYQHLEGKKLLYGECPLCGELCQPEFDDYNDMSYEFVSCCECDISWTLHHGDIPLSDNNPSNRYCISDISDY